MPTNLITARCELLPAAAGHSAMVHLLMTSSGVRRFLWDNKVVSREQTAEIVATSAALVRVLEKPGFTQTRREVVNGLDTVVYERSR